MPSLTSGLKDNQADSKLAKDLYASFLADHRERQADILTPKPKRVSTTDDIVSLADARNTPSAS